MTRDEEILARFNDGEGGNALAGAYHMTRARLYQIICQFRQAGRVVRESKPSVFVTATREQRSEWRSKTPRPPHPHKAAIDALAAQGVGPREIGRRLGISHNIVVGIQYRERAQ